MNNLPPDSNPQENESIRRGWLAWFGLPHLLALLLVMASLVLFWPAVGHPFMLVDDADYVTAHPLVPLGMTWIGVGYAFVTKHSANWHPLTTISHMFDCQMFGVDPAGPHFVNILLHSLNAALLFWVLRRLTGSLWRSALVAAFFALHPLRVESVAWVAERKDVLSGFFFLLTLWAYACYVERSKLESSRFKLSKTLALLFYALAVLSKPMVVTLPFVLLLLDYWPLKRFTIYDSRFTVVRLLREKIPFFALSLILSYITFRVQHGVGAMSSLETLPVSTRFLNMLVSYKHYLAKIFWPNDLAAIYPYNLSLAVSEIVVSIIVVVALSVLAFTLCKRFQWLATGWLWFLGTLIPVIGLVQVGMQAHADRYTYLPSIGILVAVIWSVAALSARSRFASRTLGLLAALLLVPLAVATRAQLGQWQTTEKLMRHAIRVAGPSEMAHRCVAFMLARDGKLEEAAKEFRAGLELDPSAFSAVLGLGSVYASQGKDAEAERLFRQALAEHSDYATHFQLADFLQERGRLEEAKVHYLQGLALAPYYAKARNDLGNVYARQNNLPAAREQYERALRLNPKFAETHQNLGRLLEMQGNDVEAVKHFKIALALKPEFPTAHVSLGQVLARRGELTSARSHFEAALKQQTNSAQAHFALAGVFAAEKQEAQALFHLREAVRLDTNGLPAIHNLAWLLATSRQDRLRDGKEAVRLALRAVELTRTNDFQMLDTLAAAYAEADRFMDAVNAAGIAVQLAQSAGQKQLADVIHARLRLYEKVIPFRE